MGIARRAVRAALVVVVTFAVLMGLLWAVQRRQQVDDVLGGLGRPHPQRRRRAARSIGAGAVASDRPSPVSSAPVRSASNPRLRDSASCSSPPPAERPGP